MKALFKELTSHIFSAGESNSSSKSKEAKNRVKERYAKLAALDHESLLKQFESSLQGLSEEQAEELLKHYGANEILRETHSAWPLELFNAF